MMTTFDHTLFPLHGSIPPIHVQTNNESNINAVVRAYDKQEYDDMFIVDCIHEGDDKKALQIVEKILDSPTDPRGKFLRGLQLSASECIDLDLYRFLESIPRRKRSKYGKRRINQSNAERSEITKSRNREHAKATRDRRKVFTQIIEKSLLVSNRHLKSSVIDYLERNQYDYKHILAKQSINATTNTIDDTTIIHPSVKEIKTTTGETSATTMTSLTTTATAITDHNSPELSPSLFSNAFDMNLQEDTDIFSGYIDTDFPFGDISFDDLKQFFEQRDENELTLTPISI